MLEYGRDRTGRLALSHRVVAMTSDPEDRETARDAVVTRREAITAIGGAAAASTVGASSTRETPPVEASLHVRVYPGPVPLRAWVRYGFDGMRDNWPPPFQAAMDAVESALADVLRYARDRSRLPDAEVRVERGVRVRYPLSAGSLSTESLVPSRETTLDVFRDQIRGQEVGTETTCHLLLCWAPFNYRLGYGGTHPEIGLIGSESDDGAYTAANIGATELWDSRAVSRNMAIHEVLHTFISSDAAEAVGDSRCDHDLGTARRTDDTLSVSPMATAYAGSDAIDAGTRWQGRGCGDHDRFHRHDGYEGVDRFSYTARPSEATCEAVTRTLEGLFGRS